MKTLKEMRSVRGLSQRQLAARMEKKQPYIAQMEVGEIAQGVELSTIQAFVKALDCRAVIYADKIFFEEMT